MAFSLYDYQRDAVENLRSGSILCGGVGSGKSITSLYYFFSKVCGGFIDRDNFYPMSEPLDLYIITTAKKRDDREWQKEASVFLLFEEEMKDLNPSGTKLVIDSWNNIHKYVDVKNAFFIFDEQRVVGSGEWSKSFIKITKQNKWILLTATPGDNWTDYIPVFIANGFYKNRTEFERRHIVYNRFLNYKKVDRYLEVGRLIRLRDQILVTMDFKRKTKSHHIYIDCKYDEKLSRDLIKDRWNIFEEEPIRDAGQLCYLLRRVSNSDQSRIEKLKDLIISHNRTIIFYNFNYELEILKETAEDLKIEYSEWNGNKHQKIPNGEKWCYFVQYSAGAEGWNCIETDTIIFYSQSYSYKATIQAAGRIDRLNTPYTDLYFYHLKSKSQIDTAIKQSLEMKRNFNEKAFVNF